MRKKVFKYGFCLAIPGIMLIFSIIFRLAGGPFWLATNFDPAYLYLINGLHIFKGILINDVTHPGTPLQILCGLVCWVFNMGRSTQGMIDHTLTDPEFYLQGIFGVIVIFNFLVTSTLGLYVFRKTSDPWAVLLSQLPALSFLMMHSWDSVEPVMPVVANVNPEPVLIGVVNLFSLCLLMNFFADSARKRIVSSLLWAMAAGLGVAVKLNFTPLIFIPLIVLSWRYKFLFLVSSAATFFVCTLPAHSQFGIEWELVRHFFTHSGRFQTVGTTELDLPVLCQNAQRILAQYWLFSAVMLISLGLSLGPILRRKADKITFYIFATSFGIFLQYMIVFKTPGGHYLLPGIAMFGALVVLIYLQAASKFNWATRVAKGIIILGILIGSCLAINYCFRVAGLTRDLLEFHTMIHEKYKNCTFVNYYRSSDELAAFNFGDGWNTSQYMGDDLKRLYPEASFFQTWQYRLMSFKGRVWANDLLAENPCVVFVGDQYFDFSQGPYQLKLLEKGRFERLYLLTATTEKEAAFFLSASVHFAQAGQLDKAMVFLEHARSLHYQPETDVESLLHMYGAYMAH